MESGGMVRWQSKHARESSGEFVAEKFGKGRDGSKGADGSNEIGVVAVVAEVGESASGNPVFGQVPFLVFGSGIADGTLPERLENGEILIFDQRVLEVPFGGKHLFPIRVEGVVEVHGEEVFKNEGGKREEALFDERALGKSVRGFCFLTKVKVSIHPDFDAPLPIGLTGIPESLVHFFVGPSACAMNLRFTGKRERWDSAVRTRQVIPDEAGKKGKVSDFGFAFADNAPVVEVRHRQILLQGRKRDARIEAVQVVLAEVGDVAEGDSVLPQVRQATDTGAGTEAVGNDGDFGEAEDGIVEKVSTVGGEYKAGAFLIE